MNSLCTEKAKLLKAKKIYPQQITVLLYTACDVFINSSFGEMLWILS